MEWKILWSEVPHYKFFVGHWETDEVLKLLFGEFSLAYSRPTICLVSASQANEDAEPEGQMRVAVRAKIGCSPLLTFII
jgi:hypothetical protein